MSNDTSTIEVDPDELSDQVVEDLVEEGAFSEEEAEECGDDIWFEEVETPEPTKREGLYDRVSTVFSNRVGGAYSSWRERTAFIKIESVERTDRDKVKLKVSHPEYSKRSLKLSPDSSTLGNIMALAGVDNPKKLEGGRLVMTESSYSRPELIVPNNLSFYGRSKYNMYAGVSSIREKTQIKRLDEDSMFGLGIITMFSWIPALIGVFIAELSVILGGIFILPAVILTLISLLLIGYGVARFLLFALGALLRGDVSQIEA